MFDIRTIRTSIDSPLYLSDISGDNLVFNHNVDIVQASKEMSAKIRRLFRDKSETHIIVLINTKTRALCGCSDRFLAGLLVIDTRKPQILNIASEIVYDGKTILDCIYDEPEGDRAKRMCDNVSMMFFLLDQVVPDILSKVSLHKNTRMIT